MLGFREVMGMPGQAAFLQAGGSTNDHDLGPRLDADALDSRTNLRPLDLTAAQAKYGADTPGGVGISSPAPV